MRCYQHIELNKRACAFLEKNAIKTPICICCKRGGEIISKVYAHEDMFYGDGPDLHEYKLNSGGIAKEVVQIAPWSGGPMGFLCLEINGKRKFKWTEKEINKYS